MNMHFAMRNVDESSSDKISPKLNKFMGGNPQRHKGIK